jgi:hypothetical protein
VAELVEEEGDDGDVEDQEEDFEFGGMAMDFVEFDGEKRAGHDDGEPLGPAFEKPESDSLGEEESRIDEAANADAADGIGSKGGGLLKEVVDVAAARIHAKFPDPMSEDGGDVRMKELESAQADNDENNGFEELEQGDHADQPGLRTFHVTWMFHRSLLGRRRPCSPGCSEWYISRVTHKSRMAKWGIESSVVSFEF